MLLCFLIDSDHNPSSFVSLLWVYPRHCELHLCVWEAGRNRAEQTDRANSRCEHAGLSREHRVDVRRLKHNLVFQKNAKKAPRDALGRALYPDSTQFNVGCGCYRKYWKASG